MLDRLDVDLGQTFPWTCPILITLVLNNLSVKNLITVLLPLTLGKSIKIGSFQRLNSGSVGRVNVRISTACVCLRVEVGVTG